MSLDDLLVKLHECSDLLLKNGYIDESDQITQIIVQLKDENIDYNKKIEIKESIISRFNVRWLGDCYIKEFSGSYDWWNFLGDVCNMANNVIN